MKRFKTLKSYALYTLLALVFLTGCYQKSDRKMYLWLKYDSGLNYSSTKIYYDSGLNYSSTKIYYDSVQMVSISEAYVFIDSVKQ